MTWRELNSQLREAKDAKAILKLYKAERKGKHRKRWLMRIYYRYSSLRQPSKPQISPLFDSLFDGPAFFVGAVIQVARP